VPFGAYLLLKRLAVGGMAELFLARDTRHGKLVVLKRILPYLAEEAEFVRMFLDEARIAAALHHPSIVELYELGHLEGSTFIAMEWVDGIDLRKILQKEQEKGGAVPVGVAAYLVARLCEGLQHAHFARDADGKPMGIIHRDVSPQNVMVSYDGGVKLVDFGIAKATAWMSRSKPGVIKGKFLYLAPEQLTTDPLDHRTDLFALGTLLYELTTGQSPFFRSSTEAVIYSIRMENPDPPERLRPGFPVALAAIIDHCLVKDREQRYQTAGEIAEDLEEFLRSEAPTSRADVVQYVASLFGDSTERTSIYIPPNAQARKDSRTDTSTQRDGPFDSLADEHTVPLAPPARNALPEGRRETGEIDAPPTDPTKPERPRPRPPPKNPWGTPEETAPMAQPPTKPARPAAEPAAKRDLQATADLEYQAPLGEEGIGPTTVSTSGARDVEVGQVFAPMVPTMLGESAPALRPAVPRLAAPAARPAPPVPSSEDLPEVGEHSVVSAGEATIGADPVERRAAEEERSEPSEPSDPVPDAPSTRAPPRRNVAPVKAPKPVKRRPVPESDPDDLIATVDQANEFSTRGRLSRRGGLLVAIGVGVAALLVLLAVLLWPSSPVEAPLRPPPPKEAPQAVQEPPPQEPKRVRVQIAAVAGTTLSVDGKPVEPNGILERAPGEIVVKFTCPAKKKKGAQPSSLRATIPEGAGGLFSVPVPCP
jgi:serine/threonine-protein kinase